MEDIYLDHYLSFVSANKPIVETIEDAVLKVASLPSADLSLDGSGGLLSTHLKESAVVAISRMIENNFSQLPVNDQNGSIAGVLSWNSIGETLSQAGGMSEKTLVEELYYPRYDLLFLSDELLPAFKTIIEKDMVLVAKRSNPKRPVGILTTTDLAEQFDSKYSLFLRLGELEEHLRHLCNGKVSGKDLSTAIGKLPKPKASEKESLFQFTLGDYQILLNEQAAWKNLELNYDQKSLVKLLSAAREVRNAAMHFDEDRLEKLDITSVDRLTTVLKTLREATNR